MSDDTIKTALEVELFSRTAELRWLVGGDASSRLQQRFYGSSGKTYWIDVPYVPEEPGEPS